MRESNLATEGQSRLAYDRRARARRARDQPHRHRQQGSRRLQVPLRVERNDWIGTPPKNKTVPIAVRLGLESQYGDGAGAARTQDISERLSHTAASSALGVNVSPIIYERKVRKKGAQVHPRSPEEQGPDQAASTQPVILRTNRHSEDLKTRLRRSEPEANSMSNSDHRILTPRWRSATFLGCQSPSSLKY